jgi:hypothetical protein
MLGSVVYQKTSASRKRRARPPLPLLPALRFHQRNQFTGDERESDEDRRQHDARHGEDDLDVVCLQPGAEPALRAEHQHVDQARDHRRHRKRQVDQGDQQALAGNSNLAIAHEAATPNTRFSGTAISATSRVSLIADRASG